MEKTMSALWEKELDLPARGRSGRTAIRTTVERGKTMTLFNQKGPGCMKNWYITFIAGDMGVPREYSSDLNQIFHDLILKIYYDGDEKPAIEMTLAQFFINILETHFFEFDSGPLKGAPRSTVICYFPMPFNDVRIDIENHSELENASIWFQGNYVLYKDNTKITPLRLNAQYNGLRPADKFGSMLMFEADGQGFIAGLVKGVRTRDYDDAWYHTGGDLWLLDGRTDPHVLQGIGGEEIALMGFGIYDFNTESFGVPCLAANKEKDTIFGSAKDGIMYRFFINDPIWFEDSAIIRFGTRANDIDTVVYSYIEKKKQKELITPQFWNLAGPFKCLNQKDFDRNEWPEKAVKNWPSKHKLVTSQYIDISFNIPIRAVNEKGWCNFSAYFRADGKTNGGTQPVDVSAYAKGVLSIPCQGDYVIQFAHGNQAKLWVNGKCIYNGNNNEGLEKISIPYNFPKGDIEILIKLSNHENKEWRAWVFNLHIEKAK